MTRTRLTAILTTSALIATGVVGTTSAHADDDPRVPRSPQPPP